MKKQDISENQVKFVYLSIGSNLGNKKNNLEKTKYLLEQNKIKIVKISNIYESVSWPNPKFPSYLNMVVLAKTSLDPIGLFKKIKFIERFMGRKNAPKNYPRICDVDILDYDNRIFKINSKNHKILIPHPKMHKRSFVLYPLFDVSKNWVHPKFDVKIDKLILNILSKDLTSIKLI